MTSRTDKADEDGELNTESLKSKDEDTDLEAKVGLLDDPKEEKLIEKLKEHHPHLFSIHSQRLRIGLLLMAGLFATVSMRVDLSMAVTCMVNSTAFEKLRPDSNSSSFSGDPKCQRVTSGAALASLGYNGTLLWSPTMQAALFSATFYGGFVTILISGYMADRFGPKMLMLAAALDYCLITFLTPFTSTHSYEAFFVSRVVMGLGEGFFVPCMNSMASRWFPAAERSTVGALYTSGNQIATSFSSLISARLCSSTFGWPSIFYLFGSIGLLWTVVWFFISSNYPADNKWISEKEQNYLQTVAAKTHQQTRHRVPWKAIFTSKTTLSIFCCNFAYNMSATLLMAFLPTYFKEVLFIDIKNNGLYTMVPFLAQLTSKNIFGALADFLKRRGILSHTTSCRLFQGLGSLGAAAMLALLATVPDCTRPGWAVLFLGGYGFLFSAGICGFFTSLLCIAPQHTGTLSSVSMTFGNLANISGPLILGIISRNLPGPMAFSIVFGLCSLVNVLSGIFFIICGSADIQEWSKVVEKPPPPPPPKFDAIEARRKFRHRTISETSNTEF